jgi:hypothetical protein
MTSPTDRAESGQPYFANEMIPPVNPFLGLLPKKYWPRRKAYFEYTITYKTGSPNSAAQLAASAVGQAGSTNIQADADFLLIALAGLVINTDDVTLPASAAAMIQIQDSGSSQALSDFPVRFENQFGTAQNPFFLPFPRVFEKNATITTNVTNLTAVAKNVYLTFHGFKIYPETPT